MTTVTFLHPVLIHKILQPKKVTKLNVIISIHSSNQEVPGYPQKHASILQAIKLYQVHRFKQQFYELLVKDFHKGWMRMLLFPCPSSNISIVFFKQLCHFIIKLRPIVTLKCLRIFKHATLFIDGFQHKCNFAWFFRSKGQATLYLDATSMPVRIYLYVFPSKTLWGI